MQNETAKDKPTFLKSYRFSLILIVSIVIGSVLGLIFKERSEIFKPFGDVFLNLLFTVAIPTVFFSISLAAGGVSDKKRLRKILIWMIIIFVITGVISSITMLAAVKLFPVGNNIAIDMTNIEKPENINVLQQFLKAFTVSDFGELLSRKNMLALIVFSILTGLAASASGEKAKPFVDFLRAGNAVMGKVLSYIMFYAPIGLGAYFAYLVGVFGPQMLGAYFRVVMIFYPVAIIYFIVAFSIYAFFGDGLVGIKKFWSNIIPPALTAWATGSSIATIPANLDAAKRIGVPEDVREIVIPVGATIHMDGSCLAAVLKIAFLFSLFGMNFDGIDTMLMTVAAALLSGIVMSGIPGGGFLGEMMIISLFGFPATALPIISMIGTLVDPPATMINATGDTVTSMMVSRLTEQKKL